MNSPVDQDLLQLVQQNVESLNDAVKSMSEESEKERKKVGDELQRCWTALEDIKQRVELTENKVDGVENRVGRVEGSVSELRGTCNKVAKAVNIFNDLNFCRLFGGCRYADYPQSVTESFLTHRFCL